MLFGLSCIDLEGLFEMILFPISPLAYPIYFSQLLFQEYDVFWKSGVFRSHYYVAKPGKSGIIIVNARADRMVFGCQQNVMSN